MRVERMRIKRRLALTLAAAMLLLAGCGDSERVIGGDVVNVTTSPGNPGRGRSPRRRIPHPKRFSKDMCLRWGM